MAIGDLLDDARDDDEDQGEIEGKEESLGQEADEKGPNKEELTNVIHQLKPSGIDRIVPIGRTMDFSLIWDGYNMINSLSRIVEIV